MGKSRCICCTTAASCSRMEMELPAPCERPLEHLGRAAEGPPAGRGWRGGGRAGSPAYLLVQGDVVQPHAHLPGEEVAAVVTVPQEAPAERRAGQRVEGVSRATQAQSRAGCSQTLGAGVVVVQEAWLGRTQSPYRGARGPAANPSQIRRTPKGRLTHLARSWTRCQSRGGLARSTSRNSTWKHARGHTYLQRVLTVARGPLLWGGVTSSWSPPGRGNHGWEVWM